LNINLINFRSLDSCGRIITGSTEPELLSLSNASHDTFSDH